MPAECCPASTLATYQAAVDTLEGVVADLAALLVDIRAEESLANAALMDAQSALSTAIVLRNICQATLCPPMAGPDSEIEELPPWGAELVAKVADIESREIVVKSKRKGAA